MPIAMSPEEREAAEAIQAALQALARAAELSERAGYGTQIAHSIAEAQEHMRHALDTANGKN